MDLLENLRMSLSNFNFAMIHIIHKNLVLIKNHLNYFQDKIFKYFLRSIIDFKIFVFITYNDRKLLKTQEIFLDEKKTELYCN